MNLLALKMQSGVLVSDLFILPECIMSCLHVSLPRVILTISLLFRFVRIDPKYEALPFENCRFKEFMFRIPVLGGLTNALNFILRGKVFFLYIIFTVDISSVRYDPDSDTFTIVFPQILSSHK